MPSDEIPGYGRMLLISHADGFLTAYAHNSKLLVDVGDHVDRGQRIAAVGSTGNVTSPQLHFEIRDGKKAARSRGAPRRGRHPGR